MSFETREFDHFNEKLCKIIELESALFVSRCQEQSLKIHFLSENRFSGWKTLNILDWPFDEVRMLKQVLKQGVDFYVHQFKEQYRQVRPKYITCWPNIISQYNETGAHAHDCNPFNISGAYYVSGDFDSGLIRTIFWPRSHSGTVERIYRPAKGSFILFPATLVHHILPYNGTQARVSLGFDIFLNKTVNVPFSTLHE